jgi:hypothetical protein
MSARPADLGRGLLAALRASEGRRRQRKRDTTPDAIGMAIKRQLLERVVAEDPPPYTFQAWLLAQCLADAPAHSLGAVRAMALEVLAEWRLAAASPEFMAWLDRDAPSADVDPPTAPDRTDEESGMTSMAVHRQHGFFMNWLGNQGGEGYE